LSERGWFKIPGIREQGDRTIEEQMLGLGPALEEAKGKTVLDLGCAEGAISKAFAEAGAASVLGVESLEGHLAVARKLCKALPNVRFVRSHLQDYMPAHEPPDQFDIVLILGIIHKIEDPGWPLGFACRSARDLILFRGPARAGNGIVTSKHGKQSVHVPTVMHRYGFRLEKRIAGARNEGVEYWRREKGEK